ncbi:MULTISPECIES: hydantoinase B/oxoprolinase family protein [unclassified Achromobacter]|uniref:hydantoinase B/oxoprolinase family protein n=1 Tax=unclassified Achromobacter TaxID=2626865 RepID=UPI000B51E107|nr:MULTISPECIES: hydantoinase B/oxoprolinase family protein [unclassified Achromobacter]OWT80419.1 5-oxoprolinase [Achromobacter sp. HZ34]OWT82302.1 5-oxoprolinase [Achromobacter sp. HZ28]
MQTVAESGAPVASRFDPIELEILWRRLISIVDEASTAFVRTCFSTLVRDANDFAVVLTDAQGRSLAQSTMSIPSFIGSLPATVKHFLKKYPAETLRPGDVLVTNDPWMGTGHIHDVSTVMPIFFRGRLVAFAALVSHLPDIGGRLRSNANRDIYEEGLQIPMLKLIEQGKVNETLVDMIRQNIRVPEQGMGDIWAQVSGCRMMEERLLPLLEKVDLEALGAAIRERSETAMRAAIAALPDGVYESEVLHDGFEEPILIRCKLTIAGDSIAIDYAGSSPQQPRAVNVVPIYAFAYSAYPIKALLCPEVPNNEGGFLPITTQAPLGSILNPTYPAASGGRGAIGHMLSPAIFLALAKILPERVWASGSANCSVTMFGQYRGRPFNVVNFINGGQGATAARAGFSAISFPGNLGNTPVEMMEALAPIVVHKREIRRGSGGAGQQHGGDGLSFEFEITPEASSVATSFLMTRLKFPPPGLNGGEAGQRGRLTVNGQEIDPTEQRILKPGDRVVMESAGGGGHGVSS